MGYIYEWLVNLFSFVFKETSEPIFPSPLSEQTSVPLLFACTASAKTVVANPLLHLGNLTHDILHAIINLDSPPHPDIQSNKVSMLGCSVLIYLYTIIKLKDECCGS